MLWSDLRRQSHGSVKLYHESNSPAKVHERAELYPLLSISRPSTNPVKLAPSLEEIQNLLFPHHFPDMKLHGLSCLGYPCQAPTLTLAGDGHHRPTQVILYNVQCCPLTCETKLLSPSKPVCRCSSASLLTSLP